MTRPQAKATQLEDTDRVRVTRFEFAPGAETGWHRHAMDYVITADTDCQMLLEDKDGAVRHVHVPAGAAYARTACVEHNVINGGDRLMTFVEVELK